MKNQLNKTTKKILKQMSKELKKTHKKDFNFFQNRANYLVMYVKALQEGGSKLQNFCIARVNEANQERNECLNKYINLEEKYNQLKKECENNKNITITVA